MPQKPQLQPFGTLALVGVGLLGGSIALAARQRGLVKRVIGIGRSTARLAAAREARMIDDIRTLSDSLTDADLVVVCTPVDRIAEDVQKVAAAARPDVVITDVGSIKTAIVEAVDRTPAADRFVASHPLAGSEQRGWEAAQPGLFEDRMCVLTPTSATDPERLARVEAFWKSLGMRTSLLSPEEHDRVLAVTSHLPHAVAAALARLLTEPNRPFAATGFRDTTRIAAGDPTLWEPIFRLNRQPLLDAISRMQAELQELETALQTCDGARIMQWLETARRQRQALLAPPI